VFIDQSLYLFSERTQLLEHIVLICHLLHVSAVFGHLQADFTTYVKHYTELWTFDVYCYEMYLMMIKNGRNM